MSGGSLSYFYLQLQEHIGDFGDKELDDLVKDLADLFYAREWYLSSDTCKDDWIEARDKFKDKWFTEYGRQERIKKYIEEIRSDVLDRFGIDDQKCDTCEYWSHESGNREVFSTCNPVVKAEIQPEIPPYVAEIEAEYKKWINVPCIRKPLAKALYEVWKKHDIEDAERRTDE